MSTPVSFSNNTAPRFGANYKVLIADDDLIPRKLHERHVQRISRNTASAGDTFTPTVVTNGPDALNNLIAAEREGQPFDILLTDNQMGGGDDGLKLLRNIQTNDQIPHKPFAAMISSDGEPARTQALEAGAQTFFDKPIQGQLLDNFFQSFLATRHAPGVAANPPGVTQPTAAAASTTPSLAEAPTIHLELAPEVKASDTREEAKSSGTRAEVKGEARTYEAKQSTPRSLRQIFSPRQRRTPDILPVGAEDMPSPHSVSSRGSASETNSPASQSRSLLSRLARAMSHHDSRASSPASQRKSS